MEVGVQKAKRHFLRLLRRAITGEESHYHSLGSSGGTFGPNRRKAREGTSHGHGSREDLDIRRFDAPLPDDLLKLFYGGKLPKIKRPKHK